MCSRTIYLCTSTSEVRSKGGPTTPHFLVNLDSLEKETAGLASCWAAFDSMFLQNELSPSYTFLRIFANLLSILNSGGSSWRKILIEVKFARLKSENTHVSISRAKQPKLFLLSGK